MLDEKRIGFIGAGNMASALIKGIITGNLCTPKQILISDLRKEALKKLHKEFGITSCSNADIVDQSDIVIIAVKPQNMNEVLDDIKGYVGEKNLIISIAAGIPLAKISDSLGLDVRLIRVMPNTPALVQKGMSAIARGPSATGDDMAIAMAIFGAVGETVEVKEEMMDAITAVSGSGPGYVFKMMECLVEGAMAVGLKENTAVKLVIQTFLGAATLAERSDKTLSELREMVTSPGGTTAAGLAVFDKGLCPMTSEAVKAACRRSEELGKTV